MGPALCLAYCFCCHHLEIPDTFSREALCFHTGLGPANLLASTPPCFIPFPNSCTLPSHFSPAISGLPFTNFGYPTLTLCLFCFLFIFSPFLYFSFSFLLLPSPSSSEQDGWYERLTAWGQFSSRHVSVGRL